MKTVGVKFVLNFVATLINKVTIAITLILNGNEKLSCYAMSEFLLQCLMKYIPMPWEL